MSQTIKIQTANGNVTVSRTANKATITQERTCFGFKEKTVTTVTKTEDVCLHYAFADEKQITDQFKNY